MIKSVFPCLKDLMVPYLLETKHLLDYFINLYKGFFDRIESNYIYFDHMRSTHQPNIDEIIVDHKIVKKELLNKNKVYNNKSCVI